MGSKRLARYSRQDTLLFFRYVTHGIPRFIVYGHSLEIGITSHGNKIDILIVYLLHCSKPMKILSISICLKQLLALKWKTITTHLSTINAL